MKKIGRYQIRGLLGRGGMSTVYKVSLSVIDKVVALKLLSPHPNLVDLLGAGKVRRRFLAEALTMAHLRHPNLLAIWDFDEADDELFFVMEYYCNNLGLIIGENYRVEAPSRVLQVDKAIHYTRQVLSGLSCLHDAGIVHRDIKPFNILVTDEDTVKIGDFGLSKLRGERISTPANLVVGSPYYAAPEQEEDPERVDARADLYSVGVMLYRMLTGVLPLDGRKNLSAFNPDLDRTWDDFLMKAMARRREERFPSAKDMLSALDDLREAWEEKKEAVCRTPEVVTPQTPRGGAPRHRLRSQCVKVRPREARRLFGVDELWRPVQYITNDLQANKDGTVRDAATGLLWQLGGSDYPITWEQAHGYVQELNQGRFGGYEDWRLPTVDELMSLLTPVARVGDLCIEPVFDEEKRWLWTSDRRSYMAAWYVSVDKGFVSWQDFTCYYYARAVRFLVPS